ncbi:helix-turn-helix transcriptional regulator [Agarivorans sp. 1_MG-2023]|uniref:ArsR/SmtB family transcription factor n=1 Tax=Agarivorans sp. 1_MG-2023 TaxID=3062634 RepID=UPI0026E463CB|nr:winged helix-turn-helix domain-containing protein [Agarivorans sp. 1_MG-2023]MDO6765176.1 winged helix-turn-helix domain-containing protein [Agarivorans sp. 1_MG-2023]
MTTACNKTNNQAFSTSEQQLAQEQQFAAWSKALAHPARVRILSILINLDKLGGCLNSDLVSQLGLAQSTVSEHLRILKQAEFVSAEPMPPKMCYRVNHSTLTAYKELLNTLTG